MALTPRNVAEYHIFLASPGDMNLERQEVRRFFDEYNRHTATTRGIRFVVIDRRITQGTRGAAGQRWCERIWTTIATCTQQGRSVFDFLHEAVTAHFSGNAAPSLLPAPR